MGDNFHQMDTEVIDQDVLEANVATLTTAVNTNTSAIAGINITSVNNKLAGSASSGLLTLIQGNDTDIEGINDKLDATTSSALKTLIDNKVSMVLGTTASTALAGNTTTITTSQANKITANENAIDAIELKTDFISVSQNVDLDQIESDVAVNNAKNGITGAEQTKLLNIGVTNPINLDDILQQSDTNTTDINNQGATINGIKNNTLSSTLKTALDLATTTNTMQAVSINNNLTSITGIKNNTLASTLKTAVDANSAKIGFPSTLNALLSVSDTYELEVGAGAGIPRIRLMGQNGSAISSELIFIDATTNNQEYFQGCAIRFNSSLNRLEFLTDQLNDNSPTLAMWLNRSASPDLNVSRLKILTDFQVDGINQIPRNSFVYGRRVKLLSAVGSITPDLIDVPNTATSIVIQNIITSGSLSYNTTTGILTTSSTGLFQIKIKLSMKTTLAQRLAKVMLVDNDTDTEILIGRQHLSRHESSSESYSAPEIDGFFRLASGINYIFQIQCQNDGAGRILNTAVNDNSLIIRGMVLPDGYTLPSDYGED